MHRITHKKFGQIKTEIGIVMEEFSKTMPDGTSVHLVKVLLDKSVNPAVIKKEDVLAVEEIGLPD